MKRFHKSKVYTCNISMCSLVFKFLFIHQRCIHTTKRPCCVHTSKVQYNINVHSWTKESHTVSQSVLEFGLHIQMEYISLCSHTPKTLCFSLCSRVTGATFQFVITRQSQFDFSLFPCLGSAVNQSMCVSSVHNFSVFVFMPQGSEQLQRLGVQSWPTRKMPKKVFSL